MISSRLRIPLAWLFLLAISGAVFGEDIALWHDGQPKFVLVLPENDPAAGQIVRQTMQRHLRMLYAVSAPGEDAVSGPLRVLCGHPDNNAAIRRLRDNGLELTTQDLGDEGFQIVSAPGRSDLVLYSRSPRGLKHACQELLLFQTSADVAGGRIAWPLNIVRRPELAYRGCYILPCWAEHDSVESWERVLRFNSELTLNRNWFWLDGFPVAGHPAVAHVPGKPQSYDKSPLASNNAVQRLIDVSHQEGMKLLIGGGWMSWHHEQVAGKDPRKARQFYLDYLREFPAVDGFYFEQTGEGGEVRDWRPEAESLKSTIEDLLRRRADLEVAIAIGRFNNPESQTLLSRFDPQRVWWWWCWGDPHTDQALRHYRSVLSWHTTVQMSAIHGTTLPPGPGDLDLAGAVTSYDPGMGFGNSWNGYTTLGGAPGPRNFDPYTMPYFSHEYRFRERCWNPRLTDQQFALRMRRRLFDHDLPDDSIQLYLRLADACPQPAQADESLLNDVERFIQKFASHGTPRNRDTIARMAEALSGIRQARLPRP